MAVEAYVFGKLHLLGIGAESNQCKTEKKVQENN